MILFHSTNSFAISILSVIHFYVHAAALHFLKIRPLIEKMLKYFNISSQVRSIWEAKAYNYYKIKSGGGGMALLVPPPIGSTISTVVYTDNWCS